MEEETAHAVGAVVGTQLKQSAQCDRIDKALRQFSTWACILRSASIVWVRVEVSMRLHHIPILKGIDHVPVSSCKCVTLFCLIPVRLTTVLVIRYWVVERTHLWRWNGGHVRVVHRIAQTISLFGFRRVVWNRYWVGLDAVRRWPKLLTVDISCWVAWRIWSRDKWM